MRSLYNLHLLLLLVSLLLLPLMLFELLFPKQFRNWWVMIINSVLRCILIVFLVLKRTKQFFHFTSVSRTKDLLASLAETKNWETIGYRRYKVENLLLWTTRFWYYLLELTKFKPFYEGFTFVASYCNHICRSFGTRKTPTGLLACSSLVLYNIRAPIIGPFLLCHKEPAMSKQNHFKKILKYSKQFSN